MECLSTLMKVETLFCLAASLLSAGGATRESFDEAWKFARFGKLPDGSLLEEPGGAAKMATASSSEAANPPQNAIDGNESTRWCADSDAANESLIVDLGRAGQLSSIEIHWEKEAPYPFKAEVSTDGARWKLIKDQSKPANTTGKEKFHTDETAQFIRVTVGDLSEGQWASIRELQAFDAQGKLIKPVASEASAATMPSAPKFDDSQWRKLDLPHDWGIEGPFRAELENETGKLPWPGIGWYRKTLTLQESDKGKTIYLDFDGAMSQAKVFVNGKFAGEWPYGYSSFRVDLTPNLKFGQENVIAVRLDNPVKSSRWYPGGGIYRHVWLVKANPVHLAYNGTFARFENVSPQSAEVVITSEIEGAPAGAEFVHELFDATGKRVANVRSASPTARLQVKSPTLWSTGNPYLYKLRTTVVKGNEKLDSEEVALGIRTAEWKADGFYLNGERVQIKGVCNHHDLGAIGAAFNIRAALRQIEILKEMGCNSIRMTHNPPAPQLLDLCDRMGILVLDELFDMWKLAKKPNDYSKHFDQWHEREVTNFVRRDRNHPSVIAWSSGNEVYEQTKPDMFWISEKLTGLFHKHDPTRKVTAGMNNLGSALKGLGDTVDMVGFNYPAREPGIAAKVRARRPDAPIFISESSSCVSSRGCYYFPASWEKSSGFFDFQVSSYELSAPRWANRPDLDFELLERNPFMAGEYVWTGFDYFGEPTPYNLDSTNANNFQTEAERKKGLEELKRFGNKAPSRSSYFGILDLAGFPKDRYFLYQAHWRPDFPMAHILPHWNWPERTGQVTPVHVFTSGDEAELFLNGKSLGRKKRHRSPIASSGRTSFINQAR